MPCSKRNYESQHARLFPIRELILRFATTSPFVDFFLSFYTNIFRVLS